MQFNLTTTAAPGNNTQMGEHFTLQAALMLRYNKRSVG